MIARGWTYEQMELAMVRTYVRFNRNIQFVNKPEVNKNLRCTNLRIKPIRGARQKDDIYPEGSLVRLTYNGGRRSCGACCWHAYGYFIRTLFDINPNGYLRTREAIYRGKEGFEANYRQTGYRMLGGLFNGIEYMAACDCYEHRLTEF